MLGTWIRMQNWKDRISEKLRGEGGQTTSEYLVIVGVLVVLVLVAIGFFRNEIQLAAQKLGVYIKNATPS